jgi:hypothetical protein
MEGDRPLIRKVGSMSLLLLATPLLALTVLSATGCSEAPDPSVSSTDEPFSEAELAEMRKSVRTQSDFRQLKKIKLAERAGAAVVKTKASAGQTKPK